ncbi:MAG: TonB-dependent receptor [Fulvimonas sp.]|nr:TonB-dependent receptor [Fulvimonas sp.]
MPRHCSPRLALSLLALAIAQAVHASGESPQVDGKPVVELSKVLVFAPDENLRQLLGSPLRPADLPARRAATSDTASLLRDVPGISLYGAGGVSSLPVIHGLADDRNRIKLDGMDVIASCPNHMNPALSYVDPSNVGSIKVYTGVSPVSVGGDSIGGSILVDTPMPVFAASGQAPLWQGEAGVFYRSNGDARGGNLSASYATESFNLSYSGATAQADNYDAGGRYRHYVLDGVAPHVGAREVGSTAYKTRNQTLGVAFRHDNHLIEAKFGYQDLPYQLYPNQRMDMLDNREKRLNVRYLGQFGWGTLEARAYHEKVDHYMDFGADKVYHYGTLMPPMNTTGGVYPVDGMPMNTASRTDGVSLKADLALNERDHLRLGTEAQRYRLDDWWPPSPDCGVGRCIGGMAPLTFWNIRNGERDRLAGYGEWESRWTSQWTTLFGVRFEHVHADTGDVQGYNTSTTPLNTGMMKNMYETSSVGTRADFNAMDRSRSDDNLDVSAIVRYTPDSNQLYEFGLAQKTRSPNLYERYAWSRNVMALEMNNFVGDGNGYLGNPYLKPEVAHTASFTGEWHSVDQAYDLRITPYYTQVRDYIDAVQWNTATNLPAVPLMPGRFVVLKYQNRNARLYGIDVSGRMPLAQTSLGAFGLDGVLAYTHGRDTDTHDNLYDIMPLNAKLRLTHRQGGWDDALEIAAVKAKHDVSAARNEIRTPGYALVNLRGSYAWPRLRVDFGVENLFDRRYYLPLGGAYVGEGSTMSFNREVGHVVTGSGTSGTASMWGTAVPGPGRSVYASLSVKF